MSVLDVVYIIATIGVVMVSVYLGYTILDAVEDKNVINIRYITDGKMAMRVFNGMIVFIIIGTAAASIAFATQIKTHPGFSLLALFVLAFLVAVSAWIANAYREIQNEPEFAEAVDEMPVFVALVDNLPLIIAIVGIAIVIATFAKPWQGEAISL